MKTTKALILTLGIAAAISFTACDHHDNENPVGSWTSSAPQSVTATIDGATSASRTLSFDFETTGDVVLTADYDVTVPFVTDSVSNSHSYKVTASVKGTYTRVKGENDDYTLTFDKNTVEVNGTNAPELGPVTDDFINSLSAFTSIEDVEVSKDGMHMSFETDKPDVKYNFVKE